MAKMCAFDGCTYEAYSRGYCSAHYQRKRRGQQLDNNIKRYKYKWGSEKYKLKKMYDGVKKRARQLGLPFNLTPEDLTIPDTCPILGIPLAFASGHITDNTPSVDMFRPELGYVKGNVFVISNLANRIKQNVTDPDMFRKMADFIERMSV